MVARRLGVGVAFVGVALSKAVAASTCRAVFNFFASRALRRAALLGWRTFFPTALSSACIARLTAALASSDCVRTAAAALAMKVLTAVFVDRVRALRLRLARHCFRADLVLAKT